MMQKRDVNKMTAVFRDRCRAEGLSVTPQRTVIYKELLKSKEHPSAEDIFRKVKRIFPDISLDTVYRNLTRLADIGVIDVVEGYGEAKRYDPDMNCHHHFRCRNCNAIIDFNDRNYDSLSVPKAFKKGFEVRSIKVVLEGLCNECVKA